MRWLISIILFWFLSNAEAQGLYAPDGTTWIHKGSLWMYPNTFESFPKTIQASSSFKMDSVVCTNLNFESDWGNHILYNNLCQDSSGKVYIKTKSSHRLYYLYDLQDSVGTEWSTILPFEKSDQSIEELEFRFRIDSTLQLSWEGDTFRGIHFSCIDTLDVYMRDSTLDSLNPKVFRFGVRGYSSAAFNGLGLFNHFFPFYEQEADLGKAVGSIRCIELPGKQRLSYNWSQPCDYSNVGINEKSTELRLRVYPNPTSSILHIRKSSEVSSIAEVKLFTISGSDAKVPVSQNEKGHIIDLSDVPTGMYHLRFKDEEGYHFSKIVKE